MDKTKWRTKIDIFFFTFCSSWTFYFHIFLSTGRRNRFSKILLLFGNFSYDNFVFEHSATTFFASLMTFSCWNKILSSPSIPIQILWIAEGAQRTRENSNKTRKLFNGHVTGWDETTSIESDAIKKIPFDDKLFRFLWKNKCCCLFIVFQWWYDEKLSFIFPFFISHIIFFRKRELRFGLNFSYFYLMFRKCSFTFSNFFYIISFEGFQIIKFCVKNKQFMDWKN